MPVVILGHGFLLPHSAAKAKALAPVRDERSNSPSTRGATLVRLALPPPTKKSAGDGGLGRRASLTRCRYGPQGRWRTIPSALITVASPARTTQPACTLHPGLSAGSSQVHSRPALVSGLQPPVVTFGPTLWTPLWSLLLLIVAVEHSLTGREYSTGLGFCQVCDFRDYPDLAQTPKAFTFKGIRRNVTLIYAS